jgi:hypothetical protein
MLLCKGSKGHVVQSPVQLSTPLAVTADRLLCGSGMPRWCSCGPQLVSVGVCGGGHFVQVRGMREGGGGSHVGCTKVLIGGQY